MPEGRCTEQVFDDRDNGSGLRTEFLRGRPRFVLPGAEEMALRREANADLSAKVKAALLKLDRDEADLLRNLSMEAIESEEARSFLSRIPSVGELVPAARLVELEASISDGDDEVDRHGW
jgi:hypothetical protein